MLKGKHIILGVTGGIAAYKSVFLLRLLKKAGAEVQVLMTPSAKEFVAPLTFSSLSNNPVISEFFTANTGEWHSHVDLGIWADLMIVAPATASSIAKMANGVADNMLITTYLSAKEDVMVAPAMDLDMWKHPSTQRNIKTLKDDGVLIVYPTAGALASGLEGKGRMADPTDIFNAVVDYFKQDRPLKGKKVLVTAGPTYENIDPVRFIGNYSSGKMGFEIAAELAEKGAEVFLVAGPVNLETPEGVAHREDVTSAQQMYEVSEKIYPLCDMAVFAAAVADYSPEECHGNKIKRENKEQIILKLKKNPDIAASLGKLKKNNQLNIGFALETDNEEDNALKKLKAKNFDLIVLNSLNDPDACFLKDTNKITILNKEGVLQKFDTKSKKDVARDIVTSMIALYQSL